MYDTAASLTHAPVISSLRGILTCSGSTATACAVFITSQPCAGAVLRNDVVGRIMMKCLLSDMPELRLGLNDKIEDITFHQVLLGTARCTA